MPYLRICNVENMSFITIYENNILTKISKFTVLYCCWLVPEVLWLFYTKSFIHYLLVSTMKSTLKFELNFHNFVIPILKRQMQFKTFSNRKLCMTL